MKGKVVLKNSREVPAETAFFSRRAKLDRVLKLEEVLGEIERAICEVGDFVCVANESTEETRKKSYISLGKPQAVNVKIYLSKREVHAELTIEYLDTVPVKSESGELLPPFNELAEEFIEGFIPTRF